MSTFVLRAHNLAQTDQVIQDGFASRLHPRYPLELLLRVITVSVETMKIVKGLPKLVI